MPSLKKINLTALNLSFIIEITKRDFAERFAGSVLGSLWAIIWPIVNLFIYIIIFGKIMGARLPGTSEMNAYGIYLAAGLIPWTAFAATISRSTSAFIDKKHIITKINTSLPSLLCHINLSETITYIISMVVFFMPTIVYILIRAFSIVRKGTFYKKVKISETRGDTYQ